MTKNPQNAELYSEEGSRVLAKIEDMIEGGRVGVSLKPWVARAKANFASLKVRIEDEIKARVAGEEQDSAAITEQARESSAQEPQEPQDAQEEDMTTIVTHKSGDDDELSTPSTIFSRSQYASTISGIPHRATTSTDQTSVSAGPGRAAATKRGKSPSLHPAVQQMEDDAEMLFGDHTEYEKWTPEEQAAWKASAPERPRKRLREEEEDEQIEAERPAKK